MFRQVAFPPLATEISDTVSAALPGAGSTNLPVITPKGSQGLNIGLLHLILTASMTQSAASNYTVGSLLKELRITRGSEILLDALGENQVEKLFHLVTGLPIGATFNTGAFSYFNNPVSAGAAGASSNVEEIFIPLRFKSDGLPINILAIANAYTAVTDATAGTLSLQVEFWYTDAGVSGDDQFVIVTSPTALNAATDIDISQYFGETKTVDEVWVELTADTDVTYESLKVSKTYVYEKMPANALIVDEVQSPVFSHITGYFKSRMREGTRFAASGSTPNATKLIYNLAVARTPTFYLRITPDKVMTKGTMQRVG